MAFFQKLLNPKKFGRQNSRKLPYGEPKLYWKKPQFDEKSVRLVLFKDSDSGRRIIFDSKCVKEEDKQRSKWGNCGPQKFHNYQPNKTGSDGKKLEEIMFGAVGVAYKGTSLKVHVVRSPPELMLTKVFIPEKPKRLSATDEDSLNMSSMSDLTSKAISEEKEHSGVVQSIPMDVPTPSPRNWLITSIDLIDEDSGLASLNSSGSFQAPFPSPSSSCSSWCNSLNRERRLHRGQQYSFDSFGRRRSQQDILAEFTSSGRSKKCKLALGVIFGTIDEQNPEANRMFENFFFSHIALFESHVERLRQNVEKAFYSGCTQYFLMGMIESFSTLKRDIVDLYTAPRLPEPIWLNMMSYSSYRYMLCEKFLQEFMFLVTKFDNKSTHFFMSTVVTAVLSHHLAWVPTVMPAGGSPSATYLDKHSAKWVDTLAKTHPYNPLWAQLGDLYGAIGFPLKLSRTVIVGKQEKLVKRILYVLSYFIRCSDILETAEPGCLETFINNLNFSSESENEKLPTHSMQTPVNGNNSSMFNAELNSPGGKSQEKTPVAEACDLPSFMSMGLDSLLTDEEKSQASSNTDFNSNAAANKTTERTFCSACESNRKSLNLGEHNKVGKSVFYVSSDSCICDKGRKSESLLDTSTNKKQELQRRKSNLKLTLKLPTDESQNSVTNHRSSGDFSSPQVFKECKLSAVEVLEDARVESVCHIRRAPDLNIESLQSGSARPKVGGYEIKFPKNTEKVLTHEEIKALFRKQGSNSMFNEYFEGEGIAIKTIDDLDEEDRVVALPSSEDTESRYFCDDSIKAPSLPDLTAVKSSTSYGRKETEVSHRVRLGSLDQSYKRRKVSMSRQISESSAPGRCRPVTPTELGKRRHMSSMSSFEFDLLDPRSYCQELPMPLSCGEASTNSQKEFDKNFGRSLLGDYSDHYMSDFVLHGTSERNFEEKMIQDIRIAMQYSVLDEPIAEAVCVVADTDNWTVNVYSSQHLDKTGHKPFRCVASHLVTNCIESVVSMAKLKMSPEFCMMHLEDRLQEIYFKSKMMAEYLKKNKNMQDLLAMFGFDRSDLPLLVAIAGTHTPNFPLVCLS